ncbi:lycopene beta-cyclase CrtY [Sphingomonas cavernae]|uniref:Lycopene cyclase n=1 Tax=Sphingomonas cavernae TaxID=2320861 RepID=A0A418WQ12_9SPHN|nr:lycopene beta-cyclase CrtY [Sphingomonas cavernae]RJF93347.1 lycopene cyclase [Sphingomonas cavernae]
MPSKTSCDIAIVGGGLAGSLIALALHARRPELDIRLIETSAVIGGDHVWSFFGSDVAAEHRWLVAPAVAHMWRGHDVAFPAHSRSLDGRYYAILSETLDRHVRATLPAKALMTERRVAALTRSSVVLAGGDRIRAQGVIDARGAADLSALDLGWQKFVGQELVLAEPHLRDRPMVMDATVAQQDGYRFVYALPFGEERVFVEDTYYSDTPGVDAMRLRGRIADYARARGWLVDHVAREETGVLPVCMGGDFERYWDMGGTQVPKAGMRAGLFHPTTGYSLPDAVRTAILIADMPDFAGEALHDRLFEHARDAWRSRGFYRLLNKMLFRAAEPDQRYRILERFYRLDPALISRFYAARSTGLDKLRILSGKPPVPIGRAIAAVREKRA